MTNISSLPSPPPQSTQHRQAPPPPPQRNQKKHSPDTIDSATPWPGLTFTITQVSTGKAITLRDGAIILDHPSGPGNTKWKCEQNKGFLGFRDPGSGQYLGWTDQDDIHCRTMHLRMREYMVPRPRREGDYLLLMLSDDGEELFPLEARSEGRVTKVGLCKAKHWYPDVTVWRFVEVDG